MPNGLVRSGDFRNGTPILLPHNFGNPVSNPEPFGNVNPQSNPTMDSNPVTWLPSPAHFGNQVAFSLQTVPPVVLVPQNAAESVLIPITLLGGFVGSVTFTYSGGSSRNHDKFCSQSFEYAEYSVHNCCTDCACR
jgi:hypothetical protein